MKKVYDGTKTILSLSVLAFLLTGLFCTYYGMKASRNVATVDAQNRDNRAAANTAVPKDAPPFETTKAFRNLSKKGDLRAVDALITKIPPSYWVECEETPSSLAHKERLAKRDERIPKMWPPPGEKEYNFREDLEAKSIGLLKQSAEINRTSQFQDLEFVDQKVYEDEAVVITKFRISDNYYSHPVFYMTRSDGIWRIFLESYRDYGFVDTHDYYASPRPKCRDK